MEPITTQVIRIRRTLATTASIDSHGQGNTIFRMLRKYNSNPVFCIQVDNI